MTAARSRNQRVPPALTPITGGRGPQVSSVAQSGEAVKYSAAVTSALAPTARPNTNTPHDPNSPKGVRFALNRDGALLALSIHSEHRADVCSAFGARDEAFALYGIAQLEGPLALLKEASKGDGELRKCEHGLTALFQAVASFEPQDELEGMFAIQAVAMQHVALECIARGMNSNDLHARTQHLAQASKASRTFAALVETLNRHRGKVTTQRVVVEQVNVAAGGQAVVGALQGVGSQARKAVQTHGHTNTRGSARGARKGARGSALHGAHTEGNALSAARDEGAQTMPQARRGGRDWSAKGQPEPLGSRPPIGGRNRNAAAGECDAAQCACAGGLIEGEATNSKGDRVQ
jgi:hypothetical protein